MTALWITFAVNCIFVTALMLLMPYISRPNVFFGVHVAPGFRRTPEARLILRQYRLGVLAITAVLFVAFALFPQKSWPAALPILLVVQLVSSATFFVRANRQARAYFAPQSGLREADLRGDDGLPAFLWFAVVPYLILGAVAFYLHQHWDAIPARFPVHWDANWNPNGWSAKSFRGVYGPVFFGSGLITLILGLGIVTFFGSRRSNTRRSVLAIILATSFFLALVFSTVGLLPLHRPHIWITFALALVFAAVLIFWSIRKVAEPDSETEITPDSFWYAAGSIYCNPGDPAIFVQKRIGYGYTLNFGNRWSWVFMIGFIVAIIALVTLVARTTH